MSLYPVHPVARLFPPMTNDEFEGLVSAIREHGQRQPIALWAQPPERNCRYCYQTTTYERSADHPEDAAYWTCTQCDHTTRTDLWLVDGVHRSKACAVIGIEPTTEELDEDISLVAYALDANLHHRHLTQSQKAALALDVLPMLEAEARERQGHGQTGPGRTLKAQMPEALGRQSRDDAARLVGVSPRYVQDAKAIQQQAPDLLPAVQAGTKTITEAKREVKERHREQRRDDNRLRIAATPSVAATAPAAHFATILIDPPWDWGDEGDADQFGRARPDYGTMTLEQIRDLPVATLADVDCHLYLWITNRSLPKGFSLIESWGFRYVTCLTWCKPSIGMGNYFRGSTEHLLFAVRGSQPLRRRDAGTWFAAGRGERHSAKPVEAYELIESCSPGPYLDMFSRVARPDWVSWGADVAA